MAESTATAEDFALARSALLEITAAETIGDPLGFVDEGDGVVTVHLGVEMTGYPGWRWTVSIAHVEDSAPSVLETEMTPGDGALLAPEWVPWEDRLADQTADEQDEDDDTDDAVDEDEDEDDPDDDDSDDEDSDEDDSDEDDSDEDDSDDDSDDEDLDDEDLDVEDDVPTPVLHSGDVDGVDIDELVGEVDDLGLIETEVGDSALPRGDDGPLLEEETPDGRLSDEELVERPDTTEDEPDDSPIDEASTSGSASASATGVDEPEQTEADPDETGDDDPVVPDVEPARGE